MSSSYLFLFTIGPVQSFIAQARKTQDLYAGSQLLSDLMKVAIAKVGQANVIFPNTHGKNLTTEIGSLPNRLLAEVMIDETELAVWGRKIEEAVKTQFKDNADTIFQDTLRLSKDGYTYAAFVQQINQHLDIQWLFLKRTSSYADDFIQINQLLGGLKNARTFEQLTETGRKCSIDGERNVLFGAKKKKSKLQLKPNWNQLTAQEKETITHYNEAITEVYVGNLADSEGLSAVSMVKRLYVSKEAVPSVSEFPSTATVALMADLQKVNEKDKKAFKDVFNTTNPDESWVDWNDQYYYEENLTPKVIPSPAQLKLAKQKHANVNKPFCKYYALIAFDVDSMGEWLSGNKLNEGQDLQAFQKAFSATLLAYGHKAQQYLNDEKECRGRSVYAGGDDFMGFVNLHHLFPVMKELRSLFKKMVNDELQSYFSSNTNEITFSAGVVVAHYKMPLGEVVKQVKRMEDVAKDFDKNTKDAFAIAVMKKSGELVQTVSKWKNAEFWQTMVLEDVCTKLSDKDNGFSSTFIQNIDREMSIFETEKNLINNHSLFNIVNTELKRLISRSCLAKEERQAKIESFSTSVFNLYKSRQDIELFIDTLHVCDFLTRKITQE